MWRIVLLFVLVAFADSLRAGNGIISARPDGQTEKFLIVGCGWNKVAIIDRATETLEWEHLLKKGEDCNDVELTRQNDVLYAYTGGARLVTLGQEVVWDYMVKPGEELFTATQISKGRFLLGICGHPARIIELNGSGKVLKELTFETGIPAVHNQFRQLFKTGQDTYVVPLFGLGEVVEIDRDGKFLKRIKTGGNPFCVKLLPDGHWLVGCGDAHKWVEIDPELEKITHTVHSDDLAGYSLLYVAEVHRYPNGNTLLANWNGHSKDKTQPKMIEQDAGNRVVWYLKRDVGIKNISAIYPFLADVRIQKAMCRQKNMDTK